MELFEICWIRMKWKQKLLNILDLLLKKYD